MDAGLGIVVYIHKSCVYVCSYIKGSADERPLMVMRPLMLMKGLSSPVVCCSPCMSPASGTHGYVCNCVRGIENSAHWCCYQRG